MKQITKKQAYKRFNKYLNENNNEIDIEGVEFKPSTVLKKMDKTEYEAIFESWLDCKINDEEEFELIDGE